VENNVIGLKLARFPARVYERCGIAVEGSRLAIRICLVLITVEDLNLVPTQEVNTTISTSLAGPFYFSRSGPFHMQLHIAKLLAAKNITGPIDFSVTILHSPTGGFALGTTPL